MKKGNKSFLKILVLLFVTQGFQVGVWASLIGDLQCNCGMGDKQLGILLVIQSVSGIFGLLLMILFARKLSKKLILFLGVGGTGIFYGLLSITKNYDILIFVFVIGGILMGFLDFIVNRLAGDYEKIYNSKIMLKLHASFSAGTALGALSSGGLLFLGYSYEFIYIGTGTYLIIVTLINIRNTFPEPAVVGGMELALKRYSTSFRFEPPVLAAILFMGSTFFIYTAFENYLSIYLRDVMQADSFLGGIELAVLYSANMLGRILGSRIANFIGNYKLLAYSGFICLSGLVLFVFSRNLLSSMIGLMFVGIGGSTFIPLSFYIANHKSDNPDKAVSLLSGTGYIMLVVSPLLIGLTAASFGYRVAFLILVIVQIKIMILIIGKRIFLKGTLD
ncbi:MFS transporter [Bacillus sp. 196mf]|uniref:MFS transporter n=1 Tax=Bacillus sp. 196mf TaxID=1761754 RepID=UPI000D7BC381|nr:MFS transporter [Bacillus sp. 196mf]PYE88084.1 putative MFS family arabinose efflux permease [Bacillus sp. 196mf]